jgi:DNA-binding CsgD family transcriptional regulator
MARTTDVRNFSAFIFELYERSETQDSLALLEWSAETLARTVQADCAWSGWIDLACEDVEVYGAVSHNLPPDYYEYWLTIKQDDLLARDVVGSQRKFATYCRQGERQTDGMIALADRYHLNKLYAFVTHDPNSSISLFLSAYRSGRQAKPLCKEEVEYLGAALDHVLCASALTALSVETPRLVVNERGRILTSSRNTKQILRERWPQWKSDGLPDLLIEALCDTRSSGSFSRDGFSVERCQIRNIAGPSLFSVTLRADDRCEVLTDRERQIAKKIAQGLTHKEIARDLNISPATVRNHTQSALMKLGIPNKAALAALIQSNRNPHRLGWGSSIVHLHHGRAADSNL